MQGLKFSKQQIRRVISNKDTLKRPQVKGKFFYIGDEKLWVCGVTYGTFRPSESGNEFYNPEMIERDFAQMVANGINVVRVYTTPPKWFLEAALRKGLYVMVGLPWEQHVTFLESRRLARKIENRILKMIKEIAGHPAIFCYVVGNEIPSSIVRWHGRKKIERFLKRLYVITKKLDPNGLVTYVNYPTTEYLRLPFLDFHCFNVYLETQDSLEAYLSRLQNIAGNLPLVMGEIGLDSRKNGEKMQAEVLDWQIRTVFRLGCAGVFVFAWTDEWHRGGYDIEDWDFGLTNRKRRPKKALLSVQKAFAEVPFPLETQWPRISVIVCTYNGSRTIRSCFEGLRKLNYPDFEVIVVNDGSTDETAAITREYGFRLISTENQGLSNARNIGMEAATSEIVAYIDDDAFPDQDWLKYLAATFLTTDCVGVGGPNIAPPSNNLIADCVDNAPGGPLHVLISDQKAEHIPGCNMAFRTDILKAIGGFDPQFSAAGDDVDLCWRIQQIGQWLAFSPAAVVFHHRRNSVRAYLRQQISYGKAEALLERKWPQKYNSIGHITWCGRIYGNGLTKSVGLKKWRIYYGSCGSAPFQSLYGHCPTFLQSLPLMPEWYNINIFLFLLSSLGFLWKPLLMVIPLFIVSISLPLIGVVKSMTEASYNTRPLSRFGNLNLRLLTGLFHIIQPIARLYGRLRHGLTPWRQFGGPYYSFPRSRNYEIWSESRRSPMKWIKSIEAALLEHGAIVKLGGDFDRWDLEIRSGIYGAVRSQMAVEEHAGGKQLVRFRTWAKINRLGLTLIFLFSFLSLFAMIDQMWLIATFLNMIVVGLIIHVFRDCAAATGVCQRVMGLPGNLNYDYAEIVREFILRKKVRNGNKMENFDRRQNKMPNYVGPERRSGLERRNGIAIAATNSKSI